MKSAKSAKAYAGVSGGDEAANGPNVRMSLPEVSRGTAYTHSVVCVVCVTEGGAAAGGSPSGSG